MAYANNYKDLIAQFAQAAAQALDKVSEDMEDQFTSTIQRKFDQEGSRTYRHRYKGMYSGHNMHHNIKQYQKKAEIMLYDNTRPAFSWFGTRIHSRSDTLLMKWINEGLWLDVYDWIEAGRPSDIEPFRRPAIKLLPAIKEDIAKRNDIFEEIISLMEK